MTKTLQLSPGLDLPLDALMQPIALLGNRGGGKTYGGMKLYELAHVAGVQCIAIDGIGKWWGLRLGKDGHGPGLKDVYVFGGQRADFPITPDRGAFVARVLVERRIHAVLDVSQMRKGDRRRFLTDFAEEFHLLKKQEAQPSPSIVFVEEAHQVLPQKPFGDEARMLGAFEDLIREGRNQGIGVVVMDQRPATVNKNALALIEILIVLRTTYAIDRKVYVGWVVEKVADGEAGVDLEKELPFLKAGEGFFYAPMFEIFARIRIGARKTFDSSATAKIGVKTAAIGTLTPVDVERVKDAMAEVTAQVEAKDPTALRRKVAELERQLAAKPAAAPAPKPEKKEVPALTEKQLHRLEAAAQAVLDGQAKVLAAQAKLGVAVEEVAFGVRMVHAFNKGELEGMRAAPAPAAVRRPTVAPSPLRAAPPSDVPTTLGSGERRMLETLAGEHPRDLTRAQLAIMSGFTQGGGTFRTYLPKLRTLGLIDYRGDMVVLTPAGQIEASDALRKGPRGSAEIQAMWQRQLGGGEWKMLKVLIDAGGGALEREELAARAGFEVGGGTFRTYLPKLHTLGLVDYLSDKRVRANDTLIVGEA